MEHRKADEKAGATYPEDWDPCKGCGPGEFFRNNQLPTSLMYVWEIWRMLDAEIGAENTIYQMLLETHGREGFLIMLDFLNAIKHRNDKMMVGVKKAAHAEAVSKANQLSQKGRK